jgi:hypothetical protein
MRARVEAAPNRRCTPRAQRTLTSGVGRREAAFRNARIQGVEARRTLTSADGPRELVLPGAVPPSPIVDQGAVFLK